jgi:hypothetical protein
MVAQVAAIVGLILGQAYAGGTIRRLAMLLLWSVVILSLISMVRYFVEFWSKLDSSIKYRERRRLKVLERRRQRIAERRELRRLRKLERLRATDAEPRLEPPN